MSKRSKKIIISLILSSIFTLFEVFCYGKFNLGRPQGLEVDVYTSTLPICIPISFFVIKIIIFTIIFLIFFYLEFTMKDWIKKSAISLIIAFFSSLIIVFTRYRMGVMQNFVYDFVFITFSITAFILALYTSIDLIRKTLMAKESFTRLEKIGFLLQISSLLSFFVMGLTEVIVFIGLILFLIIAPISYRQTHHPISRAFFLWGIALWFWTHANPLSSSIGGTTTIVTETSMISQLFMIIYNC